MKNKPANSPNQAGLPLTEPVFLILLSLASGKKHGYAILKDVENLSRKPLTMSTSTLYGALARLEDLGWIEHVAVESPATPGLPRRVFQLSSNGRRMLEEETRRMHNFASLAQQRLSENG